MFSESIILTTQWILVKEIFLLFLGRLFCDIKNKENQLSVEPDSILQNAAEPLGGEEKVSDEKQIGQIGCNISLKLSLHIKGKIKGMCTSFSKTQISSDSSAFAMPFSPFYYIFSTLGYEQQKIKSTWLKQKRR